MSRHPEAILENNLVSQLTGLRYARVQMQAAYYIMNS